MLGNIYFCGCSSEQSEVKTYSDEGQIIDIEEGGEFIISLVCEEPQREYKWLPTYDTKSLSIVDRGYEASRDNRSEVDGVEWFRFRALKTGVIEISMAYVGLTLEGANVPKEIKAFFVHAK